MVSCHHFAVILDVGVLRLLLRHSAEHPHLNVAFFRLDDELAISAIDRVHRRRRRFGGYGFACRVNTIVISCLTCSQSECRHANEQTKG